ncbi:FAD/NAD(P)-binding domain-containing protein [Coemansia reversa NRRL 1564]|uniref:FAD/NAD(P)-binding domain-containing protein n=1 Tax=Coemansia reversa (strain ATCC 12441 / NRRL 1564) TaxID=763665 RepID=A0A2G5BL67_COERN|nr:FAD/NAD(P)-binding domain-containing protein [Coemansia reversa NRRL 1564]|eukprot:PIA19765.1 FAD/NAD(P)-binding domain-containing protein [Coemansia reversa NRRL 1564]
MSGREIHVVVVGGSWAGITAVRQLLTLSRETYPRLLITLIERRTHYFHKTGIIRGLVDSNYAKQMFIPYDRLFAQSVSKFNHRIVCSRLTKVYQSFVEIENGARIFYDYLLLATGTEYTSLPVTQSTTARECRLMYQIMRDAIDAADHIVFIGGGAVGIGMCGEVAEMHPEKHITLVHARDSLLNDDLSTGFANATELRLQKMGVEVILNESVISSAESSCNSNSNGIRRRSSVSNMDVGRSGMWEVFPQKLVTGSGRHIACNLAIWTTGSRPATDYLSTLPVSNAKTPLIDTNTGRINVRPSLQLTDANYPNIFAIGDVNSLPLSEKYATSAVDQAKHAVAGIRILIDECYDFRAKMSPSMAADSALRACMDSYSATMKRQQAVVVSLGKHQELSTSLFARFSSWIHGSKRGRRYLIDRAQRMLNY